MSKRPSSNRCSCSEPNSSLPRAHDKDRSTVPWKGNTSYSPGDKHVVVVGADVAAKLKNDPSMVLWPYMQHVLAIANPNATAGSKAPGDALMNALRITLSAIRSASALEKSVICTACIDKWIDNEMRSSQRRVV